jgi:hypothetical protein
MAYFLRVFTGDAPSLAHTALVDTYMFCSGCYLWCLWFGCVAPVVGCCELGVPSFLSPEKVLAT